MMMNKLKIIVGITAFISLFLQCACPYNGNDPIGGFSPREYWNYYDKTDFLDEWTTIDAKWKFKDGGELAITSETEVTDAYWIVGKNTLEIIIKGESTVYNVQPINETKLILYRNDQEIVLQK